MQQVSMEYVNEVIEIGYKKKVSRSCFYIIINCCCCFYPFQIGVFDESRLFTVFHIFLLKLDIWILFNEIVRVRCTVSMVTNHLALYHFLL